MNVELLESVRRAIVYYPDRFCAAQWAFARNAERVLRAGEQPEGFRACIAGHVLLHHGTHSERDLLREGGFHTGGALWERAADALGLNDDRCRELFFPSQWDKPYKQDYYLCASEEESDVAAAYLDYFIQKYGTAGEREPTAATTASEALPSERAPAAKGERAAIPERT